MEVKTRILLKATEMFFRFGIRSITMDEIAKELGMSKKTIYLHYPDKDELVYQIMLQEMLKDKQDWCVVDEKSSNQIEKFFMVIEIMKKTMTGMNASVILDIKRYHPRAWALMEAHKKDFIIPELEQDLNEGIAQGIFRSDINVPFMARYRYGQVLLGFDTQLFPSENFSVVDSQTTMMDLYIRGIMTEKGYNLYQKIQNK